MYDIARQRQGKAAELIGQLQGLLASEEADELSLRRIERDARKLMEADALGANTVLGAAAALRWDGDGVERHHRIARRIGASSEACCHNHAVSLSLIAEDGAAADAAVKAAPDDHDALGYAVECALQAGRFIHARDLCSRWHRLVPQRQHPLAGSVRALAMAASERVFQEAGVAAVLEIVGELQRRERRRSTESAFLQCDDLQYPDARGEFLYQRGIHASPEVAAELNEELASRIAGRPELMDDPGLGFVAMYIGASG